MSFYKGHVQKPCGFFVKSGILSCTSLNQTTQIASQILQSLSLFQSVNSLMYWGGMMGRPSPNGFSPCRLI